MNIVGELAQLQQLKTDGALTEEEFTLAKKKLLEGDTSEDTNTGVTPTINLSLKEGLDEVIDENSTLGDAANRYVSFQVVMSIVAFVFIIIFFIFLSTSMSDSQKKMEDQVNKMHQYQPGTRPFGQ